MKTYLNQAADNWMQQQVNAGNSMSIHVLPSLVSYAFPKPMTPQNLMTGFKCTGIYQFDRNIFTDADFAPAPVTDRPFAFHNAQLPCQSSTHDGKSGMKVAGGETEQQIISQNDRAADIFFTAAQDKLATCKTYNEIKAEALTLKKQLIKFPLLCEGTEETLDMLTQKMIHQPLSSFQMTLILSFPQYLYMGMVTACLDVVVYMPMVMRIIMSVFVCEL